MISIKDLKIFKGLMTVPASPRLVELVEWVYGQWGVLIITSGYREGDPGVHGQIPLRGLDLRARAYINPYEVYKRINTTWEYDYMRTSKQCAILHNPGPHIHLQVHPNTKKRESSEQA